MDGKRKHEIQQPNFDGNFIVIQSKINYAEPNRNCSATVNRKL